MILHLDFESRSDIDLKTAGLHQYARGRNTDIMCAAFAFDNEPVQLWRPGGILPDRFIKHVESGGEVHAHNAIFEQEITNNVATRKYNWPYLYTDQLVCTMAMAYAMGLPGYLEGTAAALGVAQQKDMVGNRLMRQYCEPKDLTPEGKIVWWNNPDDLKRIYAYCIQDVEVERAIGSRMMRLSPYERMVWQLDAKINLRGICVDVQAAVNAIAIVESEKDRLNQEIRHVSQNQIATCTAVQQIKDYLYLRGVTNSDALAKADVVDLLKKPNLPTDIRRILELRQEAGKASTAKLEAMVAGAAQTDNRLRGSFQYSGANTRRWAGRRVQLQNLPRSKINATLVDKILSRLATGNITAHEIDTIFGSPLGVISNCLRGFLVAAPAHDLLACDFSAIEARVIAWLAGEESVLEIFRTHGKIYEHAASRIFGKPMEQISDSERQVGKVAVLALGYQGGVGAFQTMARGYGVKMAPALPSLLHVANSEQLERAKDGFRHNKHRFDEITEAEYVASDLTKVFWRESNPQIVSYWSDLESAALHAVKHPGDPFYAGHPGRQIRYTLKGSFLGCRLPSGGVIIYPYPRIDEAEMPWGGKRQVLTYMSEDGQTKKWMRFKTYGGSLAENVTQSVARDLLADAMLRLESANYPVVAHVHDEIICERNFADGSLDEMAAIMCKNPDWAKDLPIKAGGFRAKRYRK